MDVKAGPLGKLSAEELILLNCGVGEASWESLGFKIKPINLKKISREYSLEELMLKLKLQYFGHLICRTDSLEMTLMLGKIEDRRRRGWQRMRRLDGITDSMDMSLSKLWVWVGGRQGSLVCCGLWDHRDLDTTKQLNWTEWCKTKHTAYCPVPQG